MNGLAGGLVQKKKVGNMNGKGGVRGNIWRNSKIKGDLKGIMEIYTVEPS